LPLGLALLHFLVDFTNLFAYKVCKPAPGKRPKEDQNGQEKGFEEGCETGDDEGAEVALICAEVQEGCAAMRRGPIFLGGENDEKAYA
jgi:hypothetical protein